MKGRESSGKSSLINTLLGRKACPVASVPGSTANARIHTMTFGNTLFEFCDVPGRDSIFGVSVCHRQSAVDRP